MSADGGLSFSAPKFAACKRLIERAAKLMDTEGFMEQLETVIGRIAHYRIIARDHDHREPKVSRMRGKGGACLAGQGRVHHDGIDPIVLYNLPHRNAAVR